MCVCARVSSSSYLEHTILIGLVLLMIRYVTVVQSYTRKCHKVVTMVLLWVCNANVKSSDHMISPV